MSRNNPLSNEEKSLKLLEVLHEGQEFYQLKELEKLAKVKGMAQKQVSETLKRLVAEGIVSSEKIGPSNFYWSFPDKHVVNKGQEKEAIKNERNALNEKLVTLEAALKSEQETQNDGGDGLKRDQLLNSIAAMKAQEKDLSDFVKRNETMDPDKAVRLEREAKELQAAANRWTDNVFIVKSWCVKKFNIEEKKLNKQFGIKENFDYLP